MYGLVLGVFYQPHAGRMHGSSIAVFSHPLSAIQKPLGRHISSIMCCCTRFLGRCVLRVQAARAKARV